MKKVLIYTTPTCGFCKQTKAFLKEKGIMYEEVDVSADQKKAEEMMQRSGQMGVPVIVITDDTGKEELIVGFDQGKLEAALA